MGRPALVANFNLSFNITLFQSPFVLKSCVKVNFLWSPQNVQCSTIPFLLKLKNITSLRCLRFFDDDYEKLVFKENNIY